MVQMDSFPRANLCENSLIVNFKQPQKWAWTKIMAFHTGIPVRNFVEQMACRENRGAFAVLVDESARDEWAWRAAQDLRARGKTKGSREREREGGVHVVEEREDMLVPALVDVSSQQPSARKHTQVV